MNTAGKPIEVSVSAAREPTEASIGTLVHRLVDDGKAYARAEIDVVKSMATERVNAAKTGRHRRRRGDLRAAGRVDGPVRRLGLPARRSWSGSGSAWSCRR
jgi:hypothetical protein